MWTTMVVKVTYINWKDMMRDVDLDFVTSVIDYADTLKIFTFFILGLVGRFLV